MQPYVHCSTAHGFQDIETPKVSFHRWLDKEDMRHTYHEILLGHSKRWNAAICDHENPWNFQSSLPWELLTCQLLQLCQAIPETKLSVPLNTACRFRFSAEYQSTFTPHTTGALYPLSLFYLCFFVCLLPLEYKLHLGEIFSSQL